MKRTSCLIFFLGILVFSEAVSAISYSCPHPDTLQWAWEKRTVGKNGTWTATAEEGWAGTFNGPNNDTPRANFDYFRFIHELGKRLWALNCVYLISNYQQVQDNAMVLQLLIPAKETKCVLMLDGTTVVCSPR